MRKKISCKVISSFSLSDKTASGASTDFIFSNITDIVTFQAATGMFTYNGRLQKSFVSNDDVTTAKILDYYL